jgi:AP-3 complex subunit beta
MKALRVMSGIKVPLIVPLIVLAIKKCCGGTYDINLDLSPYVRKAAANSIPKVLL